MAKVLDHGFVELEDYMASDLGVVNAARVSLHNHSSNMEEKEVGLINFLMKNKHGTPFEHNAFRFRIKAPIFVFREWHRHRIGHSYNEWSARYSKLEPVFYIPDYVRVQIGKPGAYKYDRASSDVSEQFRKALRVSSYKAFSEYEYWLVSGIAKEQARLFLPVNIYSEMYWTCNARSMMAFLELRNHDSAMWEIRQYAIEVENYFKSIMHHTYMAFINNGRIAP